MLTVTLGLAMATLVDPASSAAHAPQAALGYATPSPAPTSNTTDGNVTFRVLPRPPTPSPTTPVPSPSGHLPITGGRPGPALWRLVLAGGTLVLAGLIMAYSRRYRSP
ncbi:hypothetical protein ABZ570_03350 [Micromonospora sp. NPDC007271]|uniref:hypothetical protein n=1 Tax=Micromonospora sp. NPDC007271 TaxID=3154587 RepID=UPI0033E826A9